MCLLLDLAKHPSCNYDQNAKRTVRINKTVDNAERGIQSSTYRGKMCPVKKKTCMKERRVRRKGDKEQKQEEKKMKEKRKNETDEAS